MNNTTEVAVITLYSWIGLCWFVFLIAYDMATGANGAEWLIIIPKDIFLATIWPISIILQVVTHT